LRNATVPQDTLGCLVKHVAMGTLELITLCTEEHAENVTATATLLLVIQALSSVELVSITLLEKNVKPALRDSMGMPSLEDQMIASLASVPLMFLPIILVQPVKLLPWTMTNTPWLQKNTDVLPVLRAMKESTVGGVQMDILETHWRSEIIANLACVTPMKTSVQKGTVTTSLDNAWHVLETQGVGTVTPVYLAIMGTQGMDFVSHVNVTCMDQGTQNATQEQVSACARKSILGEHVVNVRTVLEQSEPVVDNAAAIELDLRVTFVTQILDNVFADLGLQE